MARKGDFMSESFTLYKLIVLYMLDKVDFPLTNGQISEFILDKGYTTYFTLQQAISEMVEAGFLREETTHNRTLYHLTGEGAETIHFFRNNISYAIRQDIDMFFAEKSYDLKNEVSVKADYYQTKNLEFAVRCQILESGSPLIDLTLTVPTEEEAVSVANNWNKKNQEVYAQIMASLL
jgi:DNA-binding PadR family transcriptional regulator